MSNESILNVKVKVNSGDSKSQIDSITKSLKNIVKANKSVAAAVAGVTVAATAAIKSVKNAIEVAAIGDTIKDEAQKMMMTTTEYQEWGYVMEQNGIQIKSLGTLMKTFSNNVVNNQQKLKAYGITTSDISTAFSEAVFKIQQCKTETEKLAMATDLFGTRASQLMPVFNMTSAETQKLMMTYRTIGATMSNELIASSDNLTDSILEMKMAWQGLKNSLSQALIPTIASVVQWLTMLIARVSIIVKAIFGIKETFGGVEKPINAIDSGTANINTNVGNTLKKVKQLRRTLLGIDELNTLQASVDSADNTGSGGGGGSISGGSLDMGDGIFGDLGDLEKLEGFKDRIEEIKGLLQLLIPTLLIAAGGLLCLLGPAGIAAGIPLMGLGISIMASDSWQKAVKDIEGPISYIIPIVTTAIGLLIALLGFLTANIPMGIVGIGIAALGITIGTMTGGWSKAFEDLGSMINKYQDVIISCIGLVAALAIMIFLGPPGVVIGLALAGLSIGVAMSEGGWSGFFDSIINAAANLKTWFNEKIKPIFTKEYWVEKWNNIKDSVTEKFGDIKESLSQKWEDIKDSWGDFCDGVKEKWQGLKDKVSEWWDDSKIKSGLDNLKEKFSDLGDNIKDKTVEFKAKVATKWSDIKENWTNITDNIKDKNADMKAKIATKWSDLKESWTNITSNIKDKNASMKAKIGTKWSDLKEKWNTLMSNFKDKTFSIKLALSAKIDDIKNLINTRVIDKINDKFSKIPILKNHLLPRLAKGGILTEPTAALLGEYPGARNNPEIATPQSLLLETLAISNSELVGAFAQMTRQVIKAIEDNEMSVVIGDETIARSTQRGNQSSIRRTGKPILTT